MRTIGYLFDWRDAAVCREVDPELFFPEKGEPTAGAKRVCAGCPVRAECLRDAVEAGNVHGVWGGLSGKERKGLVVAARLAGSVAA